MTIQKEVGAEENYDKVQYGTVTISYDIIRSKRIKTSEIIVDADNKIIIRTPLGKDICKIRNLVLGKASWIQKQHKEMVPEVLKPSFQEGSTLPYLGKSYPIKILKRQPKNSIRFVDHQFVIRMLPSSTPKDCSDLITKRYHGWLMRAARPIFKNKVEEISSKLGIDKPKKISIKKLKNRWGSLTPSGTINVNLSLLKAPSGIIDYIILHELCHLKIKEHSHHFWDLLHKFMPDYQEKIDWLNINGNNLI
jgi:predicted metal-dependent hydrolase